MRQEFLLETTTLISGRSDIRLLRNEEGTRASEDIKNSTSFYSCLVWGHWVWGKLFPQPLEVSGCHSLTEQDLKLSEMILDSQEVKSSSEGSVDWSNLFYHFFLECLRITQSS